MQCRSVVVVELFLIQILNWVVLNFNVDGVIIKMYVYINLLRIKVELLVTRSLKVSIDWFFLINVLVRIYGVNGLFVIAMTVC